MTVAIYDRKGQPHAKGYYDVFKTEPYAAGASLTVTKLVPQGAWHLPGLLASIVQHSSAGKSLLIVGHGTTHGLTIPLAPGKKKTAGQFRQLKALIGNKSLREKALYCNITEAEVKNILALREKVVKLGLKRVEFRACEMGGSRIALAALKDFLGAGVVGAPDMLDFFGTLNFGEPNKDGNFWQKWLKAHPKAKVYNLSGGRVALHRLLQFSCLGETSAAVAQWVKAYLPATAGNVGTKLVPAHAFVGKDFLFPNESAYVGHIKHYSGGNPLLQGDIFDQTGALDVPQPEGERQMLARTTRRVPGTEGREAVLPGQMRRGPTGVG